MVIMKNEIKLHIKDFGPINEANLNINKINVVAGINASGKSFSSKLLFCFLTSLSDRGKFIESNGIYGSFHMSINRLISRLSQFSSDKISFNNVLLKNELESLLNTWDFNEISYEYFLNFYKSFEKIITDNNVVIDEFIKQEFKSLKSGIEFSKDKYSYLGRVINFLLLAEFGESYLKNFSGGKINFIETEDNLFNFNIEYEKDSVNFSYNVNDIENLGIGNVIYIDNGQTLNFNIQQTADGVITNNNSSPYHYISLLENLIRKESNNNNAYRKIYPHYKEKFEDNLKDMMGGLFEFEEGKHQFVFKPNNNDDPYDIRNVASGYKQMGILQSLFINNSIRENTWIILDEPEVNLHPEMQVNLAKLLIEMSKEMNVFLYINTHSAVLMEAMEVYSVKYGLKDKISFYLTQKNENVWKFDIKQIQHTKLYEIYNNLGDPYDIIDRIRGENISNHL